MADDETPSRSDGQPTDPSEAPGATAGPDATSTSAGAVATLRENGWGPWIVIGAALLVVLALIVVAGNDDDGSASTAAGASGGSATTVAPADGGAAPTSKPDAADTTKPADDCADFSLGANLLGVPGVASEPGVHVWHDVDGFHVRRVLGDGIPDEVTGTVTPTGPALVLVSPEAPAASVTDGVLSFTLGGGTDEVLFKAPCSTSKVTFDLQSAGAPLAASIVTVGRGETPPGVPFTLERGAP